MSNIKPFTFESSEIRVLTDESGESWFVLRDVLSAMGTSVRTNVARADIEQGLGDGYINDTPIIDSLGRNQQATIISEPAVTFLVSRSNTETGKRLNRWIHTEILPSIRKTGSYSTKSTFGVVDQIEKAAHLYPMLAKAFESVGITGNPLTLAVDNSIKNSIGLSLIAMSEIKLVTPEKAQALSPTDLGERLGGLKAKDVNELLIANGLQVRHRDSKNRPYYEPTDSGRPYCEMVFTGKKHSDGTPVRQMKWLSTVLDVLQDIRQAA